MVRDAFCSRSPGSATAQKPPRAQGGASHKTPHRAPERKVCSPCYGRENVTVPPAPRQHGKKRPAQWIDSRGLPETGARPVPPRA